MCLTIPGMVVDIKGKNKEDVVVDYGFEKREVKNIMIKRLKIGDYVIVSNKMVLQIIPEKQAEAQLKEISKLVDKGKINK